MSLDSALSHAYHVNYQFIAGGQRPRAHRGRQKWTRALNFNATSRIQKQVSDYKTMEKEEAALFQKPNAQPLISTLAFGLFYINIPQEFLCLSDKISFFRKGVGRFWKKRRKRQRRKKDGRLYNLWLSQQTISPLFSEVGRKWERGGRPGEKQEKAEETEAARAMLFYGSCHMDEGAARPWERTLTFNNGASTGPPGLFSPERQAPRGAIRAWIGAWQPCAAPQGIHKRWHIDSPCLCAAWVGKREGLKGWDSFSLINYRLKLVCLTKR